MLLLLDTHYQVHKMNLNIIRIEAADLTKHVSLEKQEAFKEKLNTPKKGELQNLVSAEESEVFVFRAEEMLRKENKEGDIVCYIKDKIIYWSILLDDILIDLYNDPIDYRDLDLNLQFKLPAGSSIWRQV